MNNNEMNFKEEQERSVLSIFHQVSERNENGHDGQSFIQILIPFILRRRKSDVNLSLPPKKEVTVYTKMTNLQLHWYNKLVDEIIRRYITEVTKTRREISSSSFFFVEKKR